MTLVIRYSQIFWYTCQYFENHMRLYNSTHVSKCSDWGYIVGYLPGHFLNIEAWGNIFNEKVKERICLILIHLICLCIFILVCCWLIYQSCNFFTSEVNKQLIDEMWWQKVGWKVENYQPLLYMICGLLMVYLSTGHHFIVG